MAKTSAHMDARTDRQRETLTWLAPNKVGKFNDRVLRLAANDRFAEGVATYNASTSMEQTFDSKADAEELAELMRGDANARYVSVNREGERWHVNAQRFDGPSTDELAHMAADGNELAFWALYARVLPKIERNAVQFGDFGPAFDEDDVHQRQVEILIGLLEDLDFSTTFVGKFNAHARHVFHEAQRATKAYSVPQDNSDMRLVETTVRAHAGDVEAAAEDLAFNPERNRHISKEKFFALLAVSDASRQVEFDPTTADEVDPTQADALSSVESGFANEGLDEVWQTLSDRDKEILTLRYGLDGGEANSAAEIAEMQGLTKQRVNQIIAAAHKKIAATGSAPVEPAPLEAKPARKPAPKVEEEVREFPVRVRLASEGVPTQTAAERRANPQDGVRAPLRIREGDKWEAVYPQRVPERVELGVFRSSTELLRN